MRTCERIDGRTTEFALNCRYRGQDVRVAVKFRRASDDLVVLLHGIGCSKESFDAAFATPELDIYSICAIDLPGHGKSSKGLSHELYTLSSYAAVTKRAISQLQKRNGEPFRVYIAGHSMGGAVGVLVAGMRQIRGKITHLVNVDGNLVGEDCGLVSRSIAVQSPDRFAEEGFGRLLTELRTSGRGDFAAWAQWCEQAVPDAVHAAARSLVAWSDREVLLRQFNQLVSKAFVYGALDDKEYLLKRLERTAQLPVTAAGHFMMVDNEKAFYETLSDALKKGAENDYSSAWQDKTPSSVSFKKAAPISSK
jgi:pimeloyl-ACP methyl ester carboxylesterase